jgi:glutamate dehydrogenase
MDHPREPEPAHAGAAGAVMARVLRRLTGDGHRDPAVVDTVGRALLERVPASELGVADLDEAATALLGTVDVFLGARDPDHPGIGVIRVSPASSSFFGPEGGRTAVDVVVGDRPLLFSTVVATLARHGLSPCRAAHPILAVTRSADGAVEQVGRPGSGPADEAVIHIEVAEDLDADERALLETDVRTAMVDAAAADADTDAMRAELRRLADALAAAAEGAASKGAHPTTPSPWPAEASSEAAAFCRWALERNLILLGMRREPGDDAATGAAGGDPSHGLGVLGPSAADVARAELEPVGGDGPGTTPLVVRRSRRRSSVARPERYAEVLVADLSGPGRGPVRVLALTTLGGRSERPSRTPWVRRTLHAALTRTGVPSGSHDATLLSVLFDDLPWDVLLLADEDWIVRVLRDLLELHQRGGTSVAVLPEPTAGAVTVLVAVPTAEEPPTLRDDVTELLLSRYGSGGLEIQAELGNSGTTIMSFTVFCDDTVDPEELRAQVREACRPWSDRLTDVLVRRPDVDGRAVARRWLGRLPGTYRSATPPAVAADDLVALETVGGTGGIGFRVLPDGGDAGRWHLRIAVDGRPVELSRLVPVLESCGLRVVEEQPFALGPPEAAVIDLVVRAAPAASATAGAPPGDRTMRAAATAGDVRRAADAAAACWAGQVDTDALNALVLSASLTWDEVDVLRVLARYLVQLHPGTTVSSVFDALVANPGSAAVLFSHVHERFGPAPTGEPFDAPPAADDTGRAVALSSFDGVPRLDHERVLRDLLGIVDATVRTSAFTPGRVRPTALVLDGSRLPGVRRAATWREIWVSGPAVEGVHLRAGAVARGGLRWSDRAGDVRTEVLQLMEAQALKNAVIVPTGAKGGFVLRRRPSDPADLSGAVRAGYTDFVGALLDVVDDLHGGEVAHPAGVRADGSDTYLVVAADRGTATFSDLANSLAEERGFWLGDAFASGGSSGYDHKALGVTARGAWVSVVDHFERLGTDVDRDGITVVGVGDMSGDVFGNGMLRSRGIRLVAAFDHRHVFLDPDPDPDRSFEERRRLFGLARSSWDDYDRSVLSPGGMIVPRTDKRVHLTPACRSVLGLGSTTDAAGDDDLTVVTLPELVRAVLAAPADLLYLGGIGTYVRGDAEPDGVVGDPANDDVRIPAERLRVAVVGEGANLGLTPRGRVDAARAGVEVNADAIDNSAGVDSSDHEVNLKILLSLAERTGRLDRAGRDLALADVAEDVVARVLSHVGRQARAITRAEAASRSDLESHLTLLFDLEAAGRVDREVHALPSGSEVRRRRESGSGLLRPELAVLLAGAKEQLADELEADDLPDRPPLRELLVGATPAPLVARFGDLLDEHPLRRSIVAARLANEIVDRMGITWAHATARRTGTPLTDVAAAYWMARTTSASGPRWLAADAVAHDRRAEVSDPVVATVDALAADYLRRGTAAAWRWGEIERDAEAGATMLDADPQAGVTALSAAPAVAEVAERTSCGVADSVAAFAAADDAFGLDRLAAAVTAIPLPPSDVWAQRHRQVLLFDVDRLRRAAATSTLTAAAPPSPRPALLRQVDAAVSGADGLDALAVAVSQAWLAVEEAVGGIPRA